jgi:hypothetical protein
VDRNFDSKYQIGDGPAFQQTDVPKAWTVSLFSKDTTATSYPSTPDAQTPSNSDTGLYSFANVPTGRDYKVCVAAAGSDERLASEPEE